MTGPYQLYRLYHDDGTSKTWGVCFNGDGTFTSVWGKTGTKMASKTKGISHPDDVQNLIRSKQRKGYEYLGGTFYIDDDGKIITDPTSASSSHQDPHPTQESLCIYWRIKIPGTATSSEIAFFQGIASGYAVQILDACPRSEFIVALKSRYRDISFVKSESGIFRQEDGVFPFLLMLAMKKSAPSTITVSLSHEDGVEISDQLKLETDALSYFDTDLESIRSIAEEIGLLQKRLDLSTIAPEIEDYYF